MVHVLAVITAKPGKREEVLRHFRANVPAVRAEKGCIEYGAAVDAEAALPVQTRYGAHAIWILLVAALEAALIERFFLARRSEAMQ